MAARRDEPLDFTSQETIEKTSHPEIRVLRIAKTLVACQPRKS